MNFPFPLEKNQKKLIIGLSVVQDRSHIRKIWFFFFFFKRSEFETHCIMIFCQFYEILGRKKSIQNSSEKFSSPLGNVDYSRQFWIGI